MLYLITPNYSLQWCDLPATSTLRIATEHGADLAGLDWLPAERAFTPDLLRLALRRGHACSAGLILKAADTTDLGRGDELRRLDAERRRLEQALSANNEFMEQLMPGWTKTGEQLDREITANTEQSAARADREVANMLAAPEVPALVEHWERLGGDHPGA